MIGIPNYLWRLVPANPILLRVVETAGKRKRDLLIRCIYLGLLTFFVIFSLASSAGTVGGTSFADLTKESIRIFEKMSYLQLTLVALLAPIFTAGAITQEKDSQTYDILLATPLSNAQILLGSLLSRLFFVIALLISGIPIFSVTQIFGGVAIKSIVTSFGIAAATAFVTGALAMSIATFKVGTRRTIFSFYMFVVIYLIGGILLDQLEWTHPSIGVETDSTGKAIVDSRTGEAKQIVAKTSWVTPLNPFLALKTIFNDPSYTPPELGQLQPESQKWPWGWAVSNPASAYITTMFGLSVVLVVPAAIVLRRIAQSSNTLQGWVLQKLKLSKGDRTRKPRAVWNNPIAWREAKTKASAFRASLLRYVFIIAGIVGAIALLFFFRQTRPPVSSIGPGSYNATAQTLFVSGRNSATYNYDPDSTRITLNGKEVAGEKWLRGSYEVAELNRFPSAGKRNVLSLLALRDLPRTLAAAEAQRYLLGMVWLEFAVILLIVTNAAASTVTREKEDGTLDLLLSTPITSRYYIWGKLRGLVAFVLPLVAVPVGSVALFIVYDSFRKLATSNPDFNWVVFPEAIIVMPATLIMVIAFAAILGMQMSLRMRTTVRAVMASVGIMLGVSSTLFWCGYSALTQFGKGTSFLPLAFGSFSPFTVMSLLIAPQTFGGNAYEGLDSSDLWTNRLTVTFLSLVATAAYAGLVWVMYTSMVKNFDMTIRKQSR